MRSRATILVVAVLLGAPLGGRVRAAPREEAPAQGTAAGETAPPVRQPAPKAPGSGETLVTGDEDFEPQAPSHSIALGPVGRGDLIVSADLGWLRSGFRADLGLGAWIDLVLRADALLLYDGLGAQDGIHLGVRVSPMSKGLFRAGGEFSVGQIFAPGAHTVTNVTALRASGTAGVVLDLATIYGRGEIRWLSSMKTSGPGWTHDGEVGVGLERAFGKRGRLILGAEWYVWVRPELESLGQWRLRVGFAI